MHSQPARAARAGPWLRAALTAGGLLAVVVGTATPAWAHTQLVSMSPAVGSTVSVAPTQVLLTFDEAIQAIGDAVVVTGPDGHRVDDGAPVIAGATATERLLPLTLRGHYAVSYRVVSDDGHPVTRTLGFDLSVGAQPATPAAPVPAGPRAPTVPGGRSTMPVLLASAVALGLAGLVGVRIRRRGQGRQ